MKKLLTFLLSLVFTSVAWGGNLNLYVSGYVFEESTQEPVANHLVTIKIKNEDPLVLYFQKLYTNESGFFSCALELPVNAGVVKVSTIDCNNQIILHSIPFNTLKTHITTNFVICHNPLLSFCRSDFLYVPDAQYPYTFYFKDASMGDIQTWLWDFGDGNFSSEPNPQHTYNVEGRYDVCLWVTGNDGACTDQYCETLSIFEETLCEALFTSFPFSGIDNTIQLWDLSTGSISAWNWDFGDGNSSELQNPVHSYQASGIYPVCLTVSDNSGNCSSTYCVDVEVNPVAECTANYSYFYDQNNILSMQFLDFSQGEPDSWLWDFGDGSVSFNQSPVHVFPEEGVYDVSLTIFNQNTGCQDSYCEMVMVYNQIPCTSFFNFYQFPVDPTSYQFVDMSSGNIAMYHWDFGDGHTSEYQNPVHGFYENGTYDVCLTISDETGICNDFYCETLYVGFNPDCEANYYFLQDSINPLTVHFSDISSGEVDVWEWNFGDGTTSSVQNPSHVFSGEGVYIVSLTIGNNAGTCSDELCREVIISGQQACQADYNYFIFPENPLMVQFIDMSTGVIDVWIWDFGDGNYSFETDPIHVYQNEGDYTVCLYVMNTLTGATDQYCKYIEIANNPDCFVEFTFLPTSGNIFTFQFADQSGENIVEWDWDFGDGSISILKNPVHTFPGEGVYETCLTVKNFMGNCQETICKSVVIDVPDLCNADFGYSYEVGQLLTVQFTDKSTGILNRWFWDFGDGGTSETQNPVHSYADSGSYIVQLSVFHNDSIAFCNSTLLEQVPVYAEKPFCQAGFSAVPDSGVNKPFLFQFKDSSLGEPDSWYWDFGDGSTSEEQNPSHQYSETGNYEVKLTITSINPYGENCTDTFASQLTMPEYWHIGGFVYGNGYPLNNPVDNGDTAIVYIYHYQNEEPVPLDTASFTELGYFYFLNLLESNYLIKYQLSNHSTNFSNYFPTYFSNNLLWEESEMLHLADSNYYHADVSLKEIPQSGNGVGQISGNVIRYIEALGGYPLPAANTEVLLFDEDMQAIAFKNTSSEGDFRFENVEYGTFYLLAESTGLHTEPISVTVTGSNPVIEDVQLCLYSSGLTGIYDHPFSQTDVQIYPNPGDKDIFLSIITSDDDDDVIDIRISEITGQQVTAQSAYINPGKNTLHLDISSLHRGVYVLKINSSNGRYYKTLKFIK